MSFVTPDALSRNPVLMIIQEDVVNRVKAAQKDDSEIQAILQMLDLGPHADFLTVAGVLFKLVRGTRCLVVPRAMQIEIVKMCHDQGHFGSKKTEELVQREFYVKDLTKRVAMVIKNCVQCILVNRKEGKQDGRLNPIPKGDVPFTTYHVDHLGHLATTQKSYKTIFCVVDSFTKFVWLYPTKGTTAKETIEKLEIQKKVFGNPRRIISDQAPTFTSSEFQNYCSNEKIEHHAITTGMPSGNGQIERVNRVIIPVLAKLTIGEPKDWWKYVHRVQMFLNNSFHRAINRSPFELMFGTRMNLTNDLRITEAIENEVAELFLEGRDELRGKARRSIDKIQNEYKRGFDRKRKEAPKYSIGDWVVIKKTQFGAGQKILPKYMGPYEVVAIKDNDRYDVKKTSTNVDGPNRTSTSAEYMKLFYVQNSSEEVSDQEKALDLITSNHQMFDTSGPDVLQDGRVGE